MLEPKPEPTVSLGLHRPTRRFLEVYRRPVHSHEPLFIDISCLIGSSTESATRDRNSWPSACTLLDGYPRMDRIPHTFDSSTPSLMFGPVGLQKFEITLGKVFYSWWKRATVIRVAFLLDGGRVMILTSLARSCTKILFLSPK